jgi:hypothetical protein
MTISKFEHYNIIKINNALKINNNLLKSEKIPSKPTPNNSENMENIVKGLISVRTLFFSMFLMRFL